MSDFEDIPEKKKLRLLNVRENQENRQQNEDCEEGWKGWDEDEIRCDTHSNVCCTWDTPSTEKVYDEEVGSNHAGTSGLQNGSEEFTQGGRKSDDEKKFSLFYSDDSDGEWDGKEGFKGWGEEEIRCDAHSNVVRELNTTNPVNVKDKIIQDEVGSKVTQDELSNVDRRDEPETYSDLMKRFKSECYLAVYKSFLNRKCGDKVT